MEDRQRKAMFAKASRQWTKRELVADEGDRMAVIYTNKKDPKLTVEMHPMDEEMEDIDDLSETQYKAWYIFPARNGKGIPNSPTVISETGGYKRADAIKELKKELIENTEGLT